MPCAIRWVNQQRRRDARQMSYGATKAPSSSGHARIVSFSCHDVIVASFLVRFLPRNLSIKFSSQSMNYDKYVNSGARANSPEKSVCCHEHRGLLHVIHTRLQDTKARKV